MLKLLFIAWVAGMVLSALSKLAKSVKAMRAFNAKRDDICFRNEPFLWMRRGL